MKAKLAIERICADLGLPGMTRTQQDWAFEMPEAYRTPQWLERYLDAFASVDFSHDERRELLDLIFDVVNDFLRTDHALGMKAWSDTLAATEPYLTSHREQLEYWACLGLDIEDAFDLAPFAREVLSSMIPADDQSDDASGNGIG